MLRSMYDIVCLFAACKGNFVVLKCNLLLQKSAGGASASTNGNGNGSGEAVKNADGSTTYQDPLDLYCDDNPETDECRSAEELTHALLHRLAYCLQHHKHESCVLMGASVLPVAQHSWKLAKYCATCALAPRWLVMGGAFAELTSCVAFTSSIVQPKSMTPNCVSAGCMTTEMQQSDRHRFSYPLLTTHNAYPRSWSWFCVSTPLGFANNMLHKG